MRKCEGSRHLLSTLGEFYNSVKYCYEELQIDVDDDETVMADIGLGAGPAV